MKQKKKAKQATQTLGDFCKKPRTIAQIAEFMSELLRPQIIDFLRRRYEKS